MPWCSFLVLELAEAIRKQFKADTDSKGGNELKADDDIIEESSLQ